MNVQPGDLALRIRAATGASIPAGAVVRILDFVGDGSVWTQGIGQGMQRTNLWHVEYRGSATSPRGLRWAVADSELRPIRDQPGADESLTWAGLPAKPETVPA